MPHRKLRDLYRQEFRGYSSAKLIRDLFAGLTVAAVALPLALAFGVASGSTAPAGLVTAIASGIVIGALSGAPYQISGPTGAMSAVLVVLAQRYGMNGVWIAGFISGILLLVIGALRLGRFIAFIPAPVITGFTSGIAFIIAVGQLDNLLGVVTPKADSAALKLLHYFEMPWNPNWHSIAVANLVMGIMVMWPKRWATKFPGSLCSILLCTSLVWLFDWPVSSIGAIPRTLVLDDRLSLSQIPWNNLGDFVVPILSITALGAIESLLCGAVASNMTGIRLQANQELMAQGIGNILLPLIGGVPATAAIARTSVGIKAGGATRLVSIFHALGLLAFMFVCADVIARVPLAALAGVLIVTAWRMNEWEAIQFYFSRRLTSAIAKYIITFVATITLDLTYAILIGVFIAGGLFLNQASQLEVTLSEVDVEKLKRSGVHVPGDYSGIRVAYLTGPLFFAAIGHFVEAFAELSGTRVLILSMRGVPVLDTSGVAAIRQLAERLHSQGGELYFAGLTDRVQAMIERAGVFEIVGKRNVYWSAAEAITAAAAR